MTESRITALPPLLGDAPSAAISACAAAVTSAVQVGLVGAPNVDWRAAAAAIGEKIEEMFNINLVELITGAWEDLRELRECADPRKHPPDESITLPLIDHHVDVTVKPYLDVAIGGLPAIRVRFEIAFDIDLQGSPSRSRKRSLGPSPRLVPGGGHGEMPGRRALQTEHEKTEVPGESC
jgi:hypothetical protein